VNAAQLFHVLRSAAAITKASELTVFGTAAAIPWLKGREPELWISMEVDIDAGTDELNTEIDGVLGELSPFHETHGIYAQGVSIEAFIAPPKWRGRSKVITEPETGARVRVPRPVDLVVAKLVRGDAKDWEFAEYAVRNFAIDPDAVARGLGEVATAHPRYAASAEKASALIATKLMKPARGDSRPKHVGKRKRRRPDEA
jgi:hypothetical protein